jgi:HPt (histidine-containing phosphotransfer) domain-containing protein
MGFAGSSARIRGGPGDGGARNENCSRPPPAAVFDADLALTRCRDVCGIFTEIVECFFDEVPRLLPQLLAALEKGDLATVARLGHRLKGTLVYLGAGPAEEAAIRVERLGQCGGGQAEAEEAVRSLARQCETLQAALLSFQTAPAAPPPDQDRGRG